VRLDKSLVAELGGGNSGDVAGEKGGWGRSNFVNKAANRSNRGDALCRCRGEVKFLRQRTAFRSPGEHDLIGREEER